jgi:hypothetical protein
LNGQFKSAFQGAFLWAINISVLIAEITQRLPTFIARIRVGGLVITTTITAANLTQARALLVHLYGAKNIYAVSMATFKRP